MKYIFHQYEFPEGSTDDKSRRTVPCLPLTEHFIATPPLWDVPSSPEEMLRDIPRVTHRKTGFLVFRRGVRSLKYARLLARIAEALPIDWDNPPKSSSEIPTWAYKWLRAANSPD